jgi:hypothetical protein
MLIYHAWFDLKAGTGDLAFVGALDRFLARLAEGGKIRRHRLTRRALGLAPADLGEFHLMIEVDDLAQLDGAFLAVSTRDEPIESLHHAVNSLVEGARFALYRDFPDPWRQHGAEKF